MRGTPLKSLLVVPLLLALLVPLVWAKLIAPFPREWSLVHPGTEQKEIYRIAGPPTAGDFQEQQHEQWSTNSALVFRRLDVWYEDSAHPTRVTSVVVASHWHFGVETKDRVEEIPGK